MKTIGYPSERKCNINFAKNLITRKVSKTNEYEFCLFVCWFDTFRKLKETQKHATPVDFEFNSFERRLVHQLESKSGSFSAHVCFYKNKNDRFA